MEQPIDWKTVHPSVIRLLKKPQMEQRTEAWYAARRRMTITGSEAASVLEGTPWKNPYKSRNQLFREKTGQRERDQSNFATQHGTYYEDEALQKYVQQTGQRPLLFGLIEHPTIDWIGGSPDAITLDGRLVEIKCPRSKEIKPEVPSYYMAQLQLLMEVCNLEVCDFVQYRPFGHQMQDELLVIVEVKRDRQWWADAMPLFEQFHKDVQDYKANPPFDLDAPISQ